MVSYHSVKVEFSCDLVHDAARIREVRKESAEHCESARRLLGFYDLFNRKDAVVLLVLFNYVQDSRQAGRLITVSNLWVADRRMCEMLRVCGLLSCMSSGPKEGELEPGVFFQSPFEVSRCCDELFPNFSWVLGFHWDSIENKLCLGSPDMRGCSTILRV